MSLTKEAIETLLARASEAALKPVELLNAAAPVVLVQEGYTLEALERFLDRPPRIKQSVQLASPQAFAEYCLRYGEATTVVFVKERTFAAVLDYHGNQDGVLAESLPSWCTHRATYTPKHSHPWTKWAANNGKAMDQVAFALFLEARMNEITKPVAAKLLTAVLAFKESAEHTLQSAQDLSTGEVEYKFVKSNKTQSAAFPKEITIELPIFEYHPPIELDLMVRRRVGGDGSLSIWYQFKRDVEDIVQDYFNTYAAAPIKKELAKKKFPLFEGNIG